MDSEPAEMAQPTGVHAQSKPSCSVVRGNIAAVGTTGGEITLYMLESDRMCAYMCVCTCVLYMCVVHAFVCVSACVLYMCVVHVCVYMCVVHVCCACVCVCECMCSCVCACV